MNQQQRNFLIKKIEEKHRLQVNELEDVITKEPELEAFIVASLLSGKAKFLDSKKIRENVIAYVKETKGEDLVDKTSDYSWNKRRRFKNGEDIYLIKIRPEHLIEMPSDFESARQKWRNESDIAKKKIEALDSLKDTLITKVQLSSAKALENLVAEADSLSDLSLFSGKLNFFLGKIDDANIPALLPESKEPQKQISNSKRKK